MTYVAATGEYGLIVRKGALGHDTMDIGKLRDIMLNVNVLGEGEGILSFGPLFGLEAMEHLKGELEAGGLSYIDDFCTFDFYVPDWLTLGVAFAEI